MKWFIAIMSISIHIIIIYCYWLQHARLLFINIIVSGVYIVHLEHFPACHPLQTFEILFFPSVHRCGRRAENIEFMKQMRVQGNFSLFLKQISPFPRFFIAHLHFLNLFLRQKPSNSIMHNIYAWTVSMYFIKICSPSFHVLH